MRSARWVVVVLAVVGLLLSTGLVTGAEAAQARRAQVTTTIKLVGKRLDGTLSSPGAVCTKQRRVDLFYKNASAGFPTFAKVTHGRSTTKGAWEIRGLQDEGLPAGRYYVKVPSSATCKPLRSRTISVG